jgi:hypothetical protein
MRNERDPDWHPLLRLLYWLGVVAWITIAFGFFASPQGVADGLAAWLFRILTPKYVTVIMVTASFVGFYAVTRLILSARLRFRDRRTETSIVALVICFALVSGVTFARCDVFVFCSKDMPSGGDCDVDLDRQGPHCR